MRRAALPALILVLSLAVGYFFHDAQQATRAAQVAASNERELLREALDEADDDRDRLTNLVRRLDRETRRLRRRLREFREFIESQGLTPPPQGSSSSPDGGDRRKPRKPRKNPQGTCAQGICLPKEIK